MIQKRFSRKYILALLIASLGIGFASWRYFTSDRLPSGTTIVDFSDSRDTEFILDIFDRDWYWLVASTREQYSPEYMLQYRAPSTKEEDRGKMTIKIGFENNEPNGFIAYHKKNFYHGYIKFIDVVDRYRKKGWGKRLMEYALNDLKQRGATKIGLVTRTDNTAAQRLYVSLGFKEVSRDNGFVDFEYVIK